jgi:tRNA G18 (ribose-2'-O)-methylase SpoU
MRKTYVILHNIRSAHNVGSVFRTADGAGVSKIFLTGYTPTPIDRFGRPNPEIAKTSLGAVDTVPYETSVDAESVIVHLKKEGVGVVAVEQTPQAIAYKSYVPDGDTVFIFGNEVTGIPEEILAQSDAHVALPMAGSKESLNVSVCAGIVLFHFRDL